MKQNESALIAGCTVIRQRNDGRTTVYQCGEHILKTPYAQSPERLAEWVKSLSFTNKTKP
jgi:hypothetical protein